MKYGSGSSYAPSVSQRTILTTKEPTIQAAKSEIVKRLESEISSIQQYEKLQHRHHLTKAIQELSMPTSPEQIELF